MGRSRRPDRGRVACRCRQVRASPCRRCASALPRHSRIAVRLRPQDDGDAPRSAPAARPARCSIKGAPEAVLRLCAADGAGGVEAARAAAEAWPGRALRVLAVARCCGRRARRRGRLRALRRARHAARPHRPDRPAARRSEGGGRAVPRRGHPAHHGDRRPQAHRPGDRAQLGIAREPGLQRAGRSRPRRRRRRAGTHERNRLARPPAAHRRVRARAPGAKAAHRRRRCRRAATSSR